jgi:serine/threonine-protein kinase
MQQRKSNDDVGNAEPLEREAPSRPGAAMSADGEGPAPAPTSPSTRRKLSAGQLFGKYRIVRGVAVGGMAQVFLASREGPDGFVKPYVIKRILPELADDESFKKLFVTEAKVAAMLDHPNIVHVFDFEIENGDYYLVMEYVSGASISRMTRENQQRGVPLGAVAAVEIGAAVADALAYAHDLRLPNGEPLDLVHRDISPGNVIVSYDGAIKLADFGVVKTSMTTTVTGVVNGKWAYMSPEEICAQPVDRRSDLFSLGIVLYEVITGTSLFRGSSAADTASRVLGITIPAPKELVPDLDPRLDAIVVRLLQRDVAALAADLHELKGSPAFVSGASHLRSLLRTLFPERPATPALGTSLTGGARPSPVEPHNSVEAQPGSGPARDEPAAEVVLGARPAASRLEGAVTKRFVLAIAAACLVGSVMFWLIFY